MQASTWQEVARRYTALASLASLVTAAGTSGGLDVALGPNVGSTPLSVLGTQIVLQFLSSGAVPDPRNSAAALPLVGPLSSHLCAEHVMKSLTASRVAPAHC